jgi:CubicO group peptidase (beta-lactamase class C family)
MKQPKQNTAAGDGPQNPSRRSFGAAIAALAIAAATTARADDHPVIVPRGPGKKPGNFTLLLTSSPEGVGMSAERLKRIHAFLQRKIDAGEISGAVTAIARRGQLVNYEAHGYANVLTKTPMPMDGIFRMASSSKPMTGVALMMMVEEIKVRLHDPISRYIPEFRDTKVAVLRPGQPATRATGDPPRLVDLVPASRPITVLDLATHTSGLLSGGPGADVLNPQREPDDTLATYIPRLGAVPLDFQPGTRWQYSGGAGVDTLGRIVEIASGQDLDSFMRERIYEPLGMKDTCFNLPSEKRNRLLPQQRKVKGEWQVTPNEPNPKPTKYFSGAGGLVSTCRDQLLFEQMLMNRGELNGKRLLGTRTVELMGANQVGDLYKSPLGDQRGQGFGITVRDVTDWAISDTGRSNGAFGWQGAFGTMSWNDRAEEIAAVIMLQQFDLEVQQDFEKAVRQAIID